jgi:hypothetical protein
MTTEKHEVVCIRRYGLSLQSTEGADFAAKVTCLKHTPSKVYDPREGVTQEWLIPIIGNWGL